jgi:hypothetical protein
VLPLQPAGAFLRQNNLLSAPVAPATSTRRHSNPIAVVGSCTDLDEALRLRPEGDEEAGRLALNQQNEPEDFLTSIRRGIDELAAESDDEDSDEDSDEEEDDEEGCYYQASKANTYYSPDQKLPHGFPLDDALDLSDTSTASSSLLTAWNHQESDDEQDNKEDLIFQLEL